MGSRIRWYEPNIVYEISIRTVDRTFLFTPNHNKIAPLLADDVSPSALDPSSDELPKNSVINIIGGAIGRALEKYPVRLHCFESNINHLHFLLSASTDQRQNIQPFLKATLSVIASEINRLRDREGHVFGARTRTHPCVDDNSAEKKLLYAITNVAKDNLADKTPDTPFFSTYHHQANGAPLKFWHIDYTAYWAAGGHHNKRRRLKDYLTWTTWETTPLPSQQSKTIPQRQTWLRKQVASLDEAQRQTRQKNNQTAASFETLRKTDPRARPNTPKTTGPAPLCHAASKAARRLHEQRWKAVKDAHISASADYRRGQHHRQFPDGCYRPPLLSIFNTGGP